MTSSNRRIVAGAGAISLHLASDEDGASIVKPDEAAGPCRARDNTWSIGQQALAGIRIVVVDVPIDVRESRSVLTPRFKGGLSGP
ncbi:unnamed protein product [Lasius platythorax]|uniref:Uncharacterized protein n=1 Tax=Lasius platythorax TaxID=488582 RepID=A0AAV2N191_9HYME